MYLVVLMEKECMIGVRLIDVEYACGDDDDVVFVSVVIVNVDVGSFLDGVVEYIFVDIMGMSIVLVWDFM